MAKNEITVITSEQLKPPQPCVLALGNFDGVHLGHQKLLAAGLEEAKRRGVPLAVLRFTPHPNKVIFPDRELKLLTTPNQQLHLFARCGVSILYQRPFTKETANTQPEDFVRTTLRELQAVHVVVGFNYSFGARGKGNPEMLKALAAEYGIGVTVVDAQMVDGQVVSSTRIRHALSDGNIQLAKMMLGRWPSIEGRVVCGEQRGRTLGFPTANLDVHEDILIPRRGVYAVETTVQGRKFGGMMNIGVKPTFHRTYGTVVEVHLFDFAGDLYGQTLEVVLMERIREERKFASVQELQEQLQRDAAEVKSLLQILKS